MMMSGLHCTVYTAYTDYPMQLKSSAGIRPIITCGPCSLDSGRKLRKMQGNYSLVRTLLYGVLGTNYEVRKTNHTTPHQQTPQTTRKLKWGKITPYRTKNKNKKRTPDRSHLNLNPLTGREKPIRSKENRFEFESRCWLTVKVCVPVHQGWRNRAGVCFVGLYSLSSVCVRVSVCASNKGNMVLL